MSSPIHDMEIDITIIRGRKLVKNDSGLTTHLFNRKKSSDPYAIVYWGGDECGRTKTIDNTLNPEWNGSFKIRSNARNLQQVLKGDPKYSSIDIVVFDNEKLSKDDALGTVTIPLKFGDHPTNIPATWYPLGKGKAPYIAKDFSGDIEVKLSVTAHRKISNVKDKGAKAMPSTKVVAKSQTTHQKVSTTSVHQKVSSTISPAFNDIEVEVVLIQARNLAAKDSKGLLSRKKTSDPYAILYWGEQEYGRTETIDDCLNPKWNKTIKFKVGSKNMQQVLSRNPKYNSIDIVVFDKDTLNKDDPLGTVSIPCNFTDSRMAQTFPANWYKLGNGTAPYVAKDVSGEIQFKYKVTVDKLTTNALQIGEPLRLKTDLYDNTLTMKLGWSSTLGPKKKDKLKKIEAHASAICFDDALNLVDIISFNDTKTKDGSLTHCGTGQGWFSKIGLTEGPIDLGENITIRLDQVKAHVAFIGFVINSFMAKNMDRYFSKYEFTLHDENTKSVIADYKYSKSGNIGRHSAVLLCCLYRSNEPSKPWMLRTLVQATPGIITNQVVDGLQNVIHQTMKTSSFPIKHSTGPRASLVVDC